MVLVIFAGPVRAHLKSSDIELVTLRASILQILYINRSVPLIAY